MFKCNSDISQSDKFKATARFKADLLQIKTTLLIKQVLTHKYAQWIGISTPAPMIPSDQKGQLLEMAVENQADL
eukprot:3709205-Ditylum_brightwellii.AAC.1